MINRQKRSGDIRFDIIACGIIGVCILFLFTGAWVDTLDGDFNAYGWGVNFSEIARALSNGELFLWNPNIWGGYQAFITLRRLSIQLLYYWERYFTTHLRESYHIMQLQFIM